jgi:Holliday junction resolvase RusA-like endonuclease
MESLFKCTIPGRPYVKKNGAKRYGKKLVYTPQYRQWAQDAIFFVKRAMIDDRVCEPLTGKLHMRALFYFQNHQSEADLSALYEGIQDILQDCGVIQDDKQIYSHDGSTKIFGLAPRLDVEIFKLD